MYNPASHTADDVRSFLKAVYTEYPTVRSSPSRVKSTPRDVCKGGALLLYSVRQGLVDADMLLKVSNMSDAPVEGEPWFNKRADDPGIPHKEWRFPLTDILAAVLVGLNPRLAETPDVTEMAHNIVRANDTGEFDHAEKLIEKALCWPNT